MNRLSRIKSIFKPLYLLLAVLVIGLVLSSCLPGGTKVARGWSGVAVDNGNVVLGSMDGRIVSVNTANGTLTWSVPLLAPPTGGGGFGCSSAPTPVAIFGTPTIDGDIVYITGYDGKVYRINSVTRDSKETSLRQGTEIAKPIIAGAALAAGQIYAGSSDGRVYALDNVSLDGKWQFATGDKIWSTPTVSGDTVYVTSFDKAIYALNAADGGKKWDFKTQGAIVSPAVVDGGAIYFGSLDRNFYALDTGGNLKWTFAGGKWFWAKPVVHNGVVYAANLDGKVYALDAANGQKLAEFDLKDNSGKSSPTSANPVLVGDQLIVATEAGDLFSIDTATKQQRRLVSLGEKVYASLAASGGKVYVHTASDKLYEIEATSGAKRELNIK